MGFRHEGSKHLIRTCHVLGTRVAEMRSTVPGLEGLRLVEMTFQKGASRWEVTRMVKGHP